MRQSFLAITQNSSAIPSQDAIKNVNSVLPFSYTIFHDKRVWVSAFLPRHKYLGIKRDALWGLDIWPVDILLGMSRSQSPGSSPHSSFQGGRRWWCKCLGHCHPHGRQVQWLQPNPQAHLLHAFAQWTSRWIISPSPWDIFLLFSLPSFLTSSPFLPFPSFLPLFVFFFFLYFFICKINQWL